MSKETGKKAASNSSLVLRNALMALKAKSAAASALSQTGAPKKVTSSTVASKASAILRDGRTSTPAKSAAASALSQAVRRKGR